VAAVAVSILQSSTGKYWNGSSFSAASETWNTATLSGGTSTSANWAYPLSLPSSDGGYTLHVRATDKVGNQTPLTSPAGSAFTIDTVPPPAPGVSSSESSPTGATSDTFTLSDTETGVTYQCQLDGGSYSACSTPKSYSGLGVGTHTFSAEALDAAGNVSKATQFSWQIVTVVPFGIAGAVPNPLYPGAPAQRIPLTLSNPMNVPITVTGLTVTVQSTNAAGCSAAWYSVTQSNLSSTQALTVPAGATAFAVPAANQPSLQMVDSHTLQDACKGARLTLSYTGSAHS
jgi:hypothetical protein